MRNKLTLAIFLIFFMGNIIPGGEVAQYVKVRPHNNFMLILDTSGSMRGQPLRQAKKAIEAFLKDIRSEDQVGMLSFNSRVERVFPVTGSYNRQRSRIQNLRAGGSTALYDAIASGFDNLRPLQGARIILYLTDGQDNQSHFTINDIRSMTKSENIFVYGIGLGNVEVNKLQNLSSATEGYFSMANSPSELQNLYKDVLAKYYQKYGTALTKTGALTIKSIPGNLPVSVSGGKRGRTPISLSSLQPGNYQVNIDYGEGSWQAEAKIKAGYRAIIDARQSEVSYPLIIGSKPVKSAVFLDGSYIGQTTITPIQKEKGFFGKVEVKNLGKQLSVPMVPAGQHTLKVVAMPDSEVDLGSSLTYEFDFEVNGKTAVNVNVITKKADFIGQKDVKQDLKDQVDDSFDELEDF